ncbi:hypothetical protein CRYUN_Cryun39dG0071600 [Craigia yunnanensis]
MSVVSSINLEPPRSTSSLTTSSVTLSKMVRPQCTLWLSHRDLRSYNQELHFFKYKV